MLHAKHVLSLTAIMPAAALRCPIKSASLVRLVRSMLTFLCTIVLQDRGLIPRVFQELFFQIKNRQESQVFCLQKQHSVLLRAYCIQNGSVLDDSVIRSSNHTHMCLC